MSDGGGITSGRVMDHYAVSAAILKVNMVCADSCRGYLFNLGAVKQFGITFGSGSNDERIGVFDSFRSEFIRFEIFNPVSGGFGNSFDEGNVRFNYNPHNSLTINPIITIQIINASTHPALLLAAMK